MRLKIGLFACCLLIEALVGGRCLRADLVTESFYLPQSNTLADGIDYGIVTLTADNVAGTVNFEVTAPYVYGGTPGNNYGFDKFLFNTNELVLTNDYTILWPSHWNGDQGSYNFSEFGRFDVLLTADRGIDATQTLTFSIQMNPGKESWATISNFATTQGPGEPTHFFFAGHVKDFAEFGGATSHNIAGLRAVPEPSTVVLWLWSGIVGLGLARRFRR